MVRPRQRAAAVGLRAERVAVAAGREPAELVAEQPGEDEPEPERLQREADDGEDTAGLPGARRGAERREQAERDRDRQPDHRAAEDETGRDRRRRRDDRRHAVTVGRRRAEVAVDDLREEVHVVVDDAPVETERWRRSGTAPGGAAPASCAAGRRR